MEGTTDIRIVRGLSIAVRFSEREHETIQEVLAYAPNLDCGIVGVPQGEINRLARRLAKVPFSARGEKELTLSRHDLSCMGSVFLAATNIRYSGLRERADVRELDKQITDFLGAFPSRREL